MIPDYQTIMLPLLKFAGDGKEHHIREAINYLAEKFGLSDEERKLLLPSGQEYVFDNRVRWAKTYLTKAGLLDSPKRGYFKITERGLNVLKNPPQKIDNKYLFQFPEFVEFKTKRRIEKKTQYESPEIYDEYTPEDLIAEGYKRLH